MDLLEAECSDVRLPLGANNSGRYESPDNIANDNRLDLMDLPVILGATFACATSWL